MLSVYKHSRAAEGDERGMSGFFYNDTPAGLFLQNNPAGDIKFKKKGGMYGYP